MTDAAKALVYVVDDDEALCDSLAFLLGSAGYRVETHTGARHFLESCTPRTGACLVLDVRMPGMSGIELQQELARRGFSLPIIFLTGHGDVPMAVEAVKKGAFHFIEKPVDDTRLLRVIEEALRRDAAGREREARRRQAAARIAELTPREREVLEHVVAGKLNKHIAEELAISVKTVEAHRSRLMLKLGADSTAALIRAALESRLD